MTLKTRSQGLVVLGAGLTGLSAAYHAGPNAQVYEAAHQPGGECITDQVKGFAFDRAGHLLHLRTPEIKQLIKRLVPNVFQQIKRDARIRLMEADLRYPVQANLFGLPPLVKADGLRSYLEAMTTSRPKPTQFQAWAQATFGDKLTQLFFEPYNRKLWTVDPAQLTLEWMGRFVPQPDIYRVVQGVFFDVPEGGGYNATFWYPKRGGIDCLAQAFTRRVPGVFYQASAQRINPQNRTVEITRHGEIPWRNLISTLPLPVLVSLLKTVPRQIREAAKQLRSNSVLVVNLGVKRECLHPAHWIYFPEADYCFYRVGFPSNYGQVTPKGYSSLFAEIALPNGTGWDQRQILARQVRADLIKAKILQTQDRIEVEHIQYLPFAYVIFDQNYAAARKMIMAYLEKIGIQSVGRWGNWEYSAMEDALLAGRLAANNL